jgi:hypothetical protein
MDPRYADLTLTRMFAACKQTSTRSMQQTRVSMLRCCLTQVMVFAVTVFTRFTFMKSYLNRIYIRPILY